MTEHSRLEQAAGLRRRAEEKAKGADGVREHEAEIRESLSPEEARRGPHELRVHQIELEMQNEELCRAQAELDAARARYLDLYDLAPVGYCTVSEKGMILEANLTAADLLGVAVGALVNKPITQFILKEDQDIYYRRRKILFETGEPQVCELRMVKMDGTQFWAYLAATAAQDADGEPVCRVVMSDITERKRAEEALRETKEYLENLIGYANAPIIVWDSQFRITRFNQAFEKLTGRRAADVIGKPLETLFPAASAESSMDLIRKTLGGTRWETVEIAILHLDGSVRTVLWNSANILGADGKTLVATMAQGQDISERKQVEEALSKSEMLNRSLVEHHTDRIFVKDRNSVYVTCNVNYARDLGVRPEQIVGKDDFAFHPWELAEKYRADDQAVMAAGATKDIEERYFVAGEEGWVHTVKVPYRDNQGNVIGVLGTFEDITERKRAEAERDNLEAQLVQAQKMEAIGQLAGGVAHDFNNILQAMVGYSSMLLDRLPEHDETHEFADEIAQGAERAAVLTRQLLAFSRRQLLEMEDLDLNEVVDGLTKMLRRIIAEDVEVEVMEGRRLDIVHADRGQMEQVLLNLCINARDAMPEGGVLTIGTENVVMDSDYCDAHAWASPGRYVLLSVADTGCGMDAQTQARIFEPFFTTKELGKGTGLGLATVYGIVRQHQGMIQVYSEVGKGTTFKVYLPSSKRTATMVRTKVVGRARGGAETILVAEDDEPLRTLAARILESAGYTVLLAANGEEALGLFEKHTADIDLCLLDVVMPKMGGKGVYDVLHQQHPRLRFLFSSGYSTNVIHTGFVLKEGIELIQKPYAPDALLRKVREVLDRPAVDPASESDPREEESPQ